MRKQVNFQRRHFEFLAGVIRELPIGAAAKVATAVHFTRELKATNPKFKAERFLEACGAGAIMPARPALAAVA